MNIYHQYDHTFSIDYLSKLRVGFVQSRLVKGDNMELKFIRNNYVFFLLKGSIVLSCGEFLDRTFNAGEMAFVPKSTDCNGYVAEDAHLIVLIYDTPICIYDKMWIESLVTTCKDVRYDFSGLAIKEQMELFLRLLENYLNDNIDSDYIYEMKQKEFFLILQSYYTKEEQARFLFPSIGRSLDFRSCVMEHYLLAKNATDLARLCGYSLRTFGRRFQNEFGEPPYSWMQKQIAKHVRNRLLETYTPFKNIATEFHFSSVEQFIRFCKTHLGDTPSVLRRKNTT